MSKRHLLGLAVCMASMSAIAVEQGEYRFNGFGTVGITRMGGESDLDFGMHGQTTDDWRGDQLSRLAGQVQYGLTDTLSFTGQVITRPLQDKWEVIAEHAYLAWRVNDNLTLRAGRVGTPIYMYSETLNIGFSYPWLRLPEEVYGLVQMSNHDGGDILFNYTTGIGTLNFQIGGGHTLEQEMFALDDMHDIDYRNVFNTNLSLATNDFGTFRVGYTKANMKTKIDGTITNMFGNRQTMTFMEFDGNQGQFSTIGHQYDNGTWLSAAEAVKFNIEDDNSTELTAFYIMAGRRFNDYLAHVTYGQQDQQSGRQVSMTYGLNYNIAPTVTLKGEYKRVDTSQSNQAAGLFQPNGQRAFDNGAFQQSGGFFGAPLGTHDADIFSIGIDFVF